ncbi:MAG TPA: TetR family transcriptional regulator [Mycobacterium sp.]|nr:TetR family transcriptional regulator [Mycobacterium sp.]
MTVSLRERKKLATKDALSQAALDLAVERGLHAATAEAIAEAADVSTRTFHNYFSNKEDAILFVAEREIRGLVDGLTARDDAEPILDSLEAILVGFVGSGRAFDRTVAIIRLTAEHPALIARHMAVHDATSNAMLAEIGRRTGTDPADDLYPRLVHHAFMAVARAVVERHVTNSGTGAPPTRRSLVAAVHDGFMQLRRGLPQPSSSD